MILFVVLGFIILIWLIITFLDSCLRHRPVFGPRYDDALRHLGITIKLFRFTWYGARANRMFMRMGGWRARSRLVSLWFDIGALVALGCSMLATALLSLLLYNTIMRKPIKQQVLVPVMPGVNLPLSQVGYYLATLLICAVIHEAGHAIAAAREGVRINGFGVFMWLLYPGAFVDLHTESLRAVSPWRQLRIYSAGIWHNLVISVAAIGLLLSLPVVLSPLYLIEHGVTITHVARGSVVSGPRGLQPGDRVTAVNSCGVRTINDWNECLRKAARSPPSGYCVDAMWRARVDLWLAPDFVSSASAAQLDPSASAGETAATGQAAGSGASSESTTFECCPMNASLANTHLCFYRPIPRPFSPLPPPPPPNPLHLLPSIEVDVPIEPHPPPAPPVQSPTSPDISNSAHRDREFVASANTPPPGPRLEYACLPARSLTERPLCTRDEDCLNSHQLCFFPTLDNRTRLLRIARTESAHLLYLGPPADLHFHVALTDYVPRFTSASFAQSSAGALNHALGGGGAGEPAYQKYSAAGAQGERAFWPTVAATTTWLLGPSLPEQVTLLLTYVMCFSGALAILNAVPCVALDGQFMWVAVLDLFAVPEPISGQVECVPMRVFRAALRHPPLRALRSSALRRWLYLGILFLGTLILLANVGLALFYLAISA